MCVTLVLSGTALASLLSPAASDHHLDGLNVVCLRGEVNRPVSTPFWPITTYFTCPVPLINQLAYNGCSVNYVFSTHIYAYGHFVIMQQAYMASPFVSTQFATHAVDPAMLASPLVSSFCNSLLSFRIIF